VGICCSIGDVLATLLSDKVDLHYHLRASHHNRQLISKVNIMYDSNLLYVCFTDIVIDLCWHVLCTVQMCVFVSFD